MGRRRSRRSALAYFDTVWTYAEVDTASDAMAVALTEGELDAGDRVALFLQKVPYVIALLAVWKLGDAVLAIAPMFHVTGLTEHIASAITIGDALLLCNRFQPDVVLDTVRRHRPG